MPFSLRRFLKDLRSSVVVPSSRVDLVNSDNPFLNKVVYLDNDREVGYLEYLVMYDKMEIQDLFVLEEYRGKGIGTKLMAYLVSVAINKRVINITLEVRCSNDVAISLYKKFGFREVALRHNYYGTEDGILMEKQVM